MSPKRGGCGPRPASVRATNPSSSPIREQRVVARARSRSSRRSSGPCPARRTSSRPGGRATPRSRPAATAAAGERSGRGRARPPRGSTARSGRATSPTNSESPVRTAQGSSPRACRPGRRRCARAGGPGCGSRAPAAAPSSSSQPSSNGSCGYSALRRAVDVDRRAGRLGQAPVPGDVVGVGVGLEDVLDAARRGSARARGTPRSRSAGRTTAADARVLVADQVRRAAEVVVDQLAEDHHRAYGRSRLPLCQSANTIPAGGPGSAAMAGSAARSARWKTPALSPNSRASVSAGSGRRSRRWRDRSRTRSARRAAAPRPRARSRGRRSGSRSVTPAAASWAISLTELSRGPSTWP